MNRFGRTLLPGLVALALVGVLTGPAARARQQPQGKPMILPARPPVAKKSDDKPNEFHDAGTLPTDREARRLLQAADDYSRKQEWRVAAEVLQSLLDIKQDSFVEVRRPLPNGGEGEVRVSMRGEANRLLGALPKEGREFYQVTYGVAAADLLKAAQTAADPEMLAEVAQRFRHTDAGRDAVALLATLDLDRGRPRKAALGFERLLADTGNDKKPAHWYLLAAIAQRRAGDAAKAEGHWARYAELNRAGPVGLAGRSFALADLRLEYEREAGAAPTVALVESPLFRGNPSRTGQGVGGTAYLDPRWQASLFARPTINERWTKAVETSQKLIVESVNALGAKPILPAMFPISAPGKVIFRTHDGVFAYGVGEGSDAGRQLWGADPVSLSLVTIAADEGARKRLTLEKWYREGYAANAAGPLGVLFENALIGSLSHDGQRVYFIDDIPIPPHPNLVLNQSMGNGGYDALTAEVGYNRLVAVDLEQGNAAWFTLGGPASSVPLPPVNDGAPVPNPRTEPAATAASELLGSYFLGPPLPLDGKLYLLSEKNGEIRLVCLDPQRLQKVNNDFYPTLVWVQALFMVANPLGQDSLRRLQAAHLAYEDGVLVCLTNAGAILGYDVQSRTLLWAHAYRDAVPGGEEASQVIMPGRFARRVPGISTSPLPERWRPAAPAIQNGRVVFTAHESQSVQCLDLRTGKLLWKSARLENDLYFAGVFGQRALVVGNSSARCLDIVDAGKELWRQEKTGQPSGQGAASAGVYYLPLRTGLESREPEIVALELETGRIVGRARSRRKEVPGNLLFTEGGVVSQTALTLSAYPQLNVMLARIDERLKADPRDPEALAERGELRLDKGDLPGAVADLHASLERQPATNVRDRARGKLHETLTDLLQSDFPAGERYLDEYRDLCKLPIPAEATAPERERHAEEQVRRDANYLCLVGRGREAQGRFAEAFAAYEGVSKLSAETVTVIDEPSTRTRPDVWTRGRIQGLLARGTPEQRRELDSEVGRRWADVKGAGDLPALRRFVVVFGGLFPAGREAQLTLAERLLVSGSHDDLIDAERALDGLCYSSEARRSDPTTAAQALEALTRVYLKRGQFEAAVGFFRRLGAEFPTVVVRDGKTGEQLLAELQTDKRFLPYLEPPQSAWSGRFKPTETAGNFQLSVSSLAIEPEGELLPFFERHRLALDYSAMQARNEWSLRLIDRASGVELWKQTNLPPALYLTESSDGKPTPKPRFAFVRGHTLVLQLGPTVIAFDLAERRELWRYALLGKTHPGTAGPTTNIKLDPENGLRLLYPDGRWEPIGHIAAVEAGYVCLQTRDGLVMLDPARPGPSVLWTKADVSTRTQIFGDSEHLYLVDSGAGNTRPVSRCLRAQDGVAVPVADFAALYTKRLRTLGRSILVAEDGPGEGKTFRLVDARTGSETWKRAFPDAKSLVRSEIPGVIGVTGSDGTVELLTERTGDTVLKTRLKPGDRADVQDVVAMADRERIYLAITRQAEAGSDWSPAVGFGLRSLRMNGPLYALDRATGQLEWTSDSLSQQYLVVDQSADLPVVLLAAMEKTIGANGRIEQQMVHVASVDKRTGKLLFDRKVTAHSAFHQLHASPATGTVELIRQNLRIGVQVEGIARETVDAGRRTAGGVRPGVNGVGGAIILPR